MRSSRPFRLLSPLLVIVGCAHDQPLTGPDEGGPVFSHVAGHLVVNSTDDLVDSDGCNATHCSLREAIADPATDEITFSGGLSGPITIDTTLTIGRNVKVTGPAGGLTIRRDPGHQNQFRVFRINSGVTVTLTNLTISGGRASGNGGGIISEGNLTLTNCTVSGNRSGLAGGGIASGGTLTLIDSRVTTNEATDEELNGAGGGIMNVGMMALTRSTVGGNSAMSSGGGIINSGTLAIVHSTVSGNSVNSSHSGAGGAGIFNFIHGNLTLVNSTVSGNTLHGGSGGGITTYGVLTLINSTVSGNSAGHVGGISVNGFYGGTLTLTNALVALNRGTSFPDIGSSGTITASHSLVGDGSGSGLENQHGLNGNLVGTSAAPIDPRLGPLALVTPGTTQTHALLAGSPALDAGSNTVCADASTVSNQDQRGTTRPQGRACDIGSFEAQPSDLITGVKATVTSLGLPSGIARSLVSKLEDALKLVNAGREPAACDKLQDFTNEVRAQTGNKISTADAAILLAAATSIRSVLRCQA